MKAKLLHTLAHDDNQVVVSIDDAVKGESYHCPTCNGDMIVRRSGKTGKGSRRPHFAHKASSNCSPESVLHFLFKTQLFDHLQQSLNEGQEVPVRWDCEKCGHVHSRPNLLAKTKAVRLEKGVGPFRPDLSMYNDAGKPILAIEIVVTHAPEEEAMAYYQSQGIHVIEYHIESQKDLKNLERFRRFEKSTVCLQPRCKKHGTAKEDLALHIAMYHCYKCAAPMKICWIQGHSGFRIGPEYFPDEALRVAQVEGVKLKSNYSRARREHYLSHNCPACDSLQGEYHIREERGCLTPLIKRTLKSKMCFECHFDQSGLATNW